MLHKPYNYLFYENSTKEADFLQPLYKTMTVGFATYAGESGQLIRSHAPYDWPVIEDRLSRQLYYAKTSLSPYQLLQSLHRDLHLPSSLKAAIKEVIFTALPNIEPQILSSHWFVDGLTALKQSADHPKALWRYLAFYLPNMHYLDLTMVLSDLITQAESLQYHLSAGFSPKQLQRLTDTKQALIALKGFVVEEFDFENTRESLAKVYPGKALKPASKVLKHLQLKQVVYQQDKDCERQAAQAAWQHERAQFIESFKAAHPVLSRAANGVSSFFAYTASTLDTVLLPINYAAQLGFKMASSLAETLPYQLPTLSLNSQQIQKILLLGMAANTLTPALAERLASSSFNATDLTYSINLKHHFVPQTSEFHNNQTTLPSLAQFKFKQVATYQHLAIAERISREGFLFNAFNQAANYIEIQKQAGSTIEVRNLFEHFFRPILPLLKTIKDYQYFFKRISFLLGEPTIFSKKGYRFFFHLTKYKFLHKQDLSLVEQFLNIEGTKAKLIQNCESNPSEAISMEKFFYAISCSHINYLKHLPLEVNERVLNQVNTYTENALPLSWMRNPELIRTILNFPQPLRTFFPYPTIENPSPLPEQEAAYLDWMISSFESILEMVSVRLHNSRFDNKANRDVREFTSYIIIVAANQFKDVCSRENFLPFISTYALTVEQHCLKPLIKLAPLIDQEVWLAAINILLTLFDDSYAQGLEKYQALVTQLYQAREINWLEKLYLDRRGSPAYNNFLDLTLLLTSIGTTAAVCFMIYRYWSSQPRPESIRQVRTRKTEPASRQRRYTRKPPAQTPIKLQANIAHIGTPQEENLPTPKAVSDETIKDFRKELHNRVEAYKQCWKNYNEKFEWSLQTVDASTLEHLSFNNFIASLYPDYLNSEGELENVLLNHHWRKQTQILQRQINHFKMLVDHSKVISQRQDGSIHAFQEGKKFCRELIQKTKQLDHFLLKADEIKNWHQLVQLLIHHPQSTSRQTLVRSQTQPHPSMQEGSNSPPEFVSTSTRETRPSPLTLALTMVPTLQATSLENAVYSPLESSLSNGPIIALHILGSPYEGKIDLDRMIAFFTQKYAFCQRHLALFESAGGLSESEQTIRHILAHTSYLLLPSDNVFDENGRILSHVFKTLKDLKTHWGRARYLLPFLHAQQVNLNTLIRLHLQLLVRIVGGLEIRESLQHPAVKMSVMDIYLILNELLSLTAQRDTAVHLFRNHLWHDHEIDISLALNALSDALRTLTESPFPYQIYPPDLEEFQAVIASYLEALQTTAFTTTNQLNVPTL